MPLVLEKKVAPASSRCTSTSASFSNNLAKQVGERLLLFLHQRDEIVKVETGGAKAGRLIAATALTTSPVLSLPRCGSNLANFSMMVLSAVRLFSVMAIKRAYSIPFSLRIPAILALPSARAP